MAIHFVDAHELMVACVIDDSMQGSHQAEKRERVYVHGTCVHERAVRDRRNSKLEHCYRSNGIHYRSSTRVVMIVQIGSYFFLL